jgi:hypothetical protein
MLIECSGFMYKHQYLFHGTHYFKTWMFCIIFKFRLLFVSHILVCTCAVRDPIHKTVCGWLLAKNGSDTSDLRGESVPSTQHKVKRQLILCLNTKLMWHKWGVN